VYMLQPVSSVFLCLFKTGVSITLKFLSLVKLQRNMIGLMGKMITVLFVVGVGW
jgi:hypothetical protein